jgi:hypothetical protein
MRDEQSKRAKCLACERAIGAAGQHDRYPRPQGNPRHIRTSEIYKLLCHHVARFKVGGYQDVSTPGDG